jgi:hypothetical protein
MRQNQSIILGNACDPPAACLDAELAFYAIEVFRTGLTF